MGGCHLLHSSYFLIQLLPHPDNFQLSTFSRYPEGATVAPPKNRFLNPDIKLAFRFKLRENI